jgi:serine/threonine protein kinase
MVTEYLNGGDLFSIMNSKKLSISDIQFYAASIIYGLSFLHEKGIIHRSLSTENLVIASDGCIKLIGFGFAKQLIFDSQINKFINTFTLCGTVGIHCDIYFL